MYGGRGRHFDLTDAQQSQALSLLRSGLSESGYASARQIIAHEDTRQMMMGPALAFNQPGLDADLPAYIASLEKRVAAGAPLRAIT